WISRLSHANYMECSAASQHGDLSCKRESNEKIFYPRHHSLYIASLSSSRRLQMNVRFMPVAAAALACALSAPIAAQWINYKTPGIPRLPDGKANLSAPAPRTADGKPDLSGIWRAGRTGDYGYDYNVAANLKPEEVQPWAAALLQQRVQDFRKDSPLARCLPVSLPFLNFRGLSQIDRKSVVIVVL